MQITLKEYYVTKLIKNEHSIININGHFLLFFYF